MDGYETLKNLENQVEQKKIDDENKLGATIETKVGDIHEDEVIEVIEEFQDAEEEEDFYDLDGEGKIKPNIGKLVWGWRGQVLDNRSRVCINSSMKLNGMGKSQLSWWECVAITDKKALDYHHPSDIPVEELNFKFDKHFFMRGGLEEIKRMTNDLQAGGILNVDEMIYLAYKRRAMSSANIDFNEWMGAKQRKTRVILVGNMPDFWDLDSYERVKANTYVECLERGWGLQFESDSFPHTDPWHEEEMINMQKLRNKRQSESLLRKIRILRRHPCFKRVINWCRIPPVAEAQYNNYVRFHNKEDNKIDTKNKFETWKNEFILEQSQEKFKIHRAIVNLVQMLEARGAKVSPVIRDAGITKSQLDKMTKEVRKVEGTIMDKIMFDGQENKEVVVKKEEPVQIKEEPKAKEDENFENYMAD